jgi:ubiquitin-protein ligase
MKMVSLLHKLYFLKIFLIHPPVVKFTCNLFHPNIYPDGKVCISILHDGVDEFGYESRSERWNPSHSVSSILISIISMLSNPNLESPANVDASVMYKNDYNLYKNIIYKTVSNSLLKYNI